MTRGRSVLSVLAARMAVAATIAAVAAGVLAILAERRTFEEIALDRANSGVIALLALVQAEGGTSSRLEGSRVQAALDLIVQNAEIQKNGRFISASVYDAAGARVGRIEDEKAMAAIGEAGARPSPPGDDPTYEYANTNGVAVVFLAVPILRQGARVGSVRGMFRISEAQMAEASARVARRALFAVGYVVLTALILYSIIAHLVRRLGRAGERLLQANLESIAALGSAIAKKDSDTDIHNYRVTIYSIRLGEAAGLDRRAICALMKGAFLHDVGKIGIPDAILLKPGRLDEREFAEMRKHVQNGLDIVKRAAWLADAASVVGGHHEKFDGSGYPQGLRGEEIPINARIFAVADVFDALTSRRPYKEPMSYEEAMGFLEKGRGAHLDPRLIDLFKGIARPLFDEFGNRDDDRPRAVLRELVSRYFRADDDVLDA